MRNDPEDIDPKDDQPINTDNVDWDATPTLPTTLADDGDTPRRLHERVQ